MHTRTTLGCVLISTLFLAGCKSGPAAPERVYRMGERAQVGPFIYSILSTDWRTSLGELPAARMPHHRFLLVQLTVTNSGGAPASVPPLALVDAGGKSYPEEMAGEGVPNWLGMLREVRPAETSQGQILFDVPAGAYRLQLSSGGDPDKEQIAWVELPYGVQELPAVPTPTLPGQTPAPPVRPTSPSSGAPGK